MSRKIPRELRRQTLADLAAAEVLRHARGVCARCGIYGGGRKVVDRGELQAECFDHLACNRRLRIPLAAESEADR